MLDIENLEESFNDYSKDFIKNKKNIMHMLAELYPIPPNLTNEEKKFFFNVGYRFFSIIKLFKV